MLKAQLVLRMVTVLLSATLVSACGGGSDDTDALPLLPPRAQPPEINQAQVFLGPLTQPSAREIETYLKNGVYASTITTGSPDVSTPLASDAAQGGRSSGFSQTNTVESGVDEADRVKYDGQYMYLAETLVYYYSPEEKPKVRVLERQQDGSLLALDSLESSADFDYIEGLYLHEDTLTVLGTNHEYFPFADFAILPYQEFEQTIAVTTFDTTNPAQAQQTQNIEIQGAILASRRIGDDLFVVSTYSPYVDGLVVGANSDQEKVANYNKIVSTPINDLMPEIRVNGQVSNINDADNCYIPQQATLQDGYSQLVNVTKIDLSQPNSVENLCLSLSMRTLYVSGESMYLVAESYDTAGTNGQTVLHKIDLTNFDYAASGSVDGLVGWRGNPLFRLSEYDNSLRIVTTDYSQVSPLHKLYVLQQNGNNLSTVASLPNETKPEAIGKPNEDIYAVRFIDDKAYIVTFELIDPLYVIDLSTPSDPEILGSLEIPGFSSYIHPMDNGYLLGVGQQISVEQLPDVEQEIRPILVPDGLKVSLFDVNDPSNPLELSNVVIPDAYTPVEFNYKALSVLNTSGAYQFSMPVEEWGLFPLPTEEGATAITVMASKNSLLMLEVDTVDNVPSLEVVKQLSTPINPDTYYYSWEDRSIIHGQQVYYIRGNHVYMSAWSSNDEVVMGPY